MDPTSQTDPSTNVAPAPRASKAIKWLAIGLPLIVLGVGLFLVIQRMEARRPPFEFAQDSPEAVFLSAKRMVSEGRADLLTELVYATSESERELLQGIGGILGGLQQAGYAAADTFPDEIRKIRENALAAVEAGGTGSVMAMIGKQMGSGGSSGPSIFADSDDIGADVIHSLLADPYGWIERNSEAVAFNPLGDRMVGLMINGAPIMLGGMLPVLMELREDDKWYIMPPTNFPGVRQAIDRMIEDDDGREMLLLVLQSIRQALEDIGTDMRSGKIRTLDHAANKLGEYALPPVGLGMIAFGKYMENVRQEQRLEKEAEKSAGQG